MRARRCIAAFAAAVSVPLAVVAAGPVAGPAIAAPGDLVLTLLHNNDGESQIPPAADGGGAAQFATVVAQERAAAAGLVLGTGGGDVGSVLVSSGDNFLAGANFSASANLPPDQQWYEARLLELLDYDAVTVGNHDLDFGPDGLERFITDAASPPIPFITANLDFSAEPGLQALVEAGRLAPATTVQVGTRTVGIIGLTTPTLRSISSPRNIGVGQDLVGAVTTQVAALTAAGVNVIILSSHLQGIGSELELIAQLDGIDAVIAGGGDELLADPGDPLLANEAGAAPFGSYPFVADDADGTDVPVVTTPGNFRYVGRLQLLFDAAGNLLQTGADSRLVPVVPGTATDPAVQAEVTAPVQAATAGLAANVVATTEVELDGRNLGGVPVRTRETNLGDLAADSLLFTAQQQAAAFGQSPPLVSLQNGGGIRLAARTVPPGPITELTTFDIFPFANFVSIVPEVTPAQLKTLLEHSVSTSPTANGLFGQWGGIRFAYDLAGTPQTVSVDTTTGESTVATPGSRITDAWLLEPDGLNGTPLIADGAVVPGAPTINLATIDFTARGGDRYPFAALNDLVSVGVSYQQGLVDYLRSSAPAVAVPDGASGLAGLGGVVRAGAYPPVTTSTAYGNRIVCQGAACPDPGDPTAGYTPLTPTRVVDTRDGVGGVAVAPLGAGQVLEVPLAGVAGVPDDATGVILNVTSTNTDTPGYLSVFPCGDGVPGTSSVNHELDPVANLVVVGLGEGGAVCVLSYVSADVVIDVAGWLKPGVAFTPATARRVGDSRDGTGVEQRVVPDDGELVVPVAGVSGVPAEATAVAISLTLTNTSEAGYATAYACGAAPYASNINYVAGESRANAAVVGVGEGGAICVRTSQEADVLVDVTGWFGTIGGLDLVPVVPARVADTRDGSGGVDVVKVPAGGEVAVAVVPPEQAAGLAGVVINLTGANAEEDGYLTASACGTDPNASNVNLVAGDGRAASSAAFSDVDADGFVCISSYSTSDVVVDLTAVVRRT